MPGAVFDLRGQVSADVSPFNSAMDASAHSVSRSLQAMQVAASTFMGSGVIRTFIKATDAATKFGQTLADISSIADYNLKSLRSSIMGLDNVYGRASKVGETMYEIISSGVRGSEKDLVEFTKIAKQTAVSIKADLYDTANVLTTLTNAYGLSAKDVQKLSDMLFVTVREGKAHGNELARTLGLVTNTAAEAGVSLAEMSATISVLSRTQSASQSMIGFNQLLNSIIKPTQEATREAQYWGIELNATALKTKGLTGVLEEMHQKTGGNVRAINAMLGNIRAMRAGVSLTGRQFENFINILKTAENEIGSGAAFEAFKKQTDTTAQAIENLRTQIDKTYITIGKDLEPVTKNLASGFESVLKSFSDESNTLGRWSMYLSVGSLTLRGVMKSLGVIKAFTKDVHIAAKNINISTENIAKNTTTASSGLSGASKSSSKLNADLSNADTKVQSLQNSIAAVANSITVVAVAIKQCNALLIATKKRTGSINTDLKSVLAMVKRITSTLNSTSNHVDKITVSSRKLFKEWSNGIKFVDPKFLRSLKLVAERTERCTKYTKTLNNEFKNSSVNSDRLYKSLGSVLKRSIDIKTTILGVADALAKATKQAKALSDALASDGKGVSKRGKRSRTGSKGTAGSVSNLPVPYVYTGTVYPPSGINPPGIGYTRIGRTIDIDFPLSPYTHYDVTRRTPKGLPYYAMLPSRYTAYSEYAGKDPYSNPYAAKWFSRFSGAVDATIEVLNDTTKHAPKTSAWKRLKFAIFGTTHTSKILGKSIGSVTSTVGKFTTGLGKILGTFGMWGFAASAVYNFGKMLIENAADKEVQAITEASTKQNIAGFRQAAYNRLSLAYNNKKLTDVEYRLYDSSIRLATSQEQLSKIIQDIANNERKKTKKSLADEYAEAEKAHADRIKQIEKNYKEQASSITGRQSDDLKNYLKTDSIFASERNTISGKDMKGIIERLKALGELAPEAEHAVRSSSVKVTKPYAMALKGTAAIDNALLNAFSQENWRDAVKELQNKFMSVFGSIDSSIMEKEFMMQLTRRITEMLKIREKHVDAESFRKDAIKASTLTELGDKADALNKRAEDAIYNEIYDVQAKAATRTLDKSGASAAYNTLDERLKIKEKADEQIRIQTAELQKLEEEYTKRGLTSDEIRAQLKGNYDRLNVTKTQANAAVENLYDVFSSHIGAIDKAIEEASYNKSGMMLKPRAMAKRLTKLLEAQYNLYYEADNDAKRQTAMRGIQHIQSQLDSTISDYTEQQSERMQLRKDAGKATERQVLESEVASRQLELKQKQRIARNVKQRRDDELSSIDADIANAYTELEAAKEAQALFDANDEESFGLYPDVDIDSIKDNIKQLKANRRNILKQTRPTMISSKQGIDDAALRLRAALLKLNDAALDTSTSLRNGLMGQVQKFAEQRDSNGRMSNDALYHSISLMSRLGGGTAIQTSKGMSMSVGSGKVANFKTAQDAQTAVSRSLDAYIMSQQYAEANKGKAVVDIYNLLKQNIGKGITVN